MFRKPSSHSPLARSFCSLDHETLSTMRAIVAGAEGSRTEGAMDSKNGVRSEWVVEVGEYLAVEKVSLEWSLTGVTCEMVRQTDRH